MSVKKKSIEYAAAALVVSVAIIAASILYIGPLGPSNQSTSSAQGGQTGTLAIRLTDPPQVPSHTSSLNLTYSALTLLVGEPTGTAGELKTTPVTVTPSGGSATIDLLRLQNVSQTIALTTVPNDSVLYSVTFTVTGIKIDVNNTVSDVTLATGGSSFLVTIAHPSAFSSGDYALLQLNPVVVNTPSGYELIPSSVGVMGRGEGPDHVGNKHQLTNGDDNGLRNARGNVTSEILALSVSGNVTTFTVLVNNSASVPVDINAIGLHGNFTVVGSACQSFGDSRGQQGTDEGNDHGGYQPNQCAIPEHMNEVVFVPVSTGATTSTTTTSTTSTASASCATGQLRLVSGDDQEDSRGYNLGAGQCVMLTFTGPISFGSSSSVLVPSTLAGQAYVLHVIASNGANQQVGCTLPLGTGSCTTLQPQQQQDSQDW
ncbi:MAG: hypothetical protein JRN06_07435 [Nitrososphaerota archaeon]|nr:hypothetical protein [Nitrososphaerota archaeon]MDG7024386.1 hypothetical protein [Nitrososphaerota archaeon]